MKHIIKIPDLFLKKGEHRDEWEDRLSKRIKPWGNTISNHIQNVILPQLGKIESHIIKAKTRGRTNGSRNDYFYILASTECVNEIDFLSDWTFSFDDYESCNILDVEETDDDILNIKIKINS